MTQLQAKQVFKIQAAPVRVSGLTVAANSASTAVTTGITAALSTAGAGEGGGSASVPVQPSSSNGLGVVTTGSTNRIEIYNATSKDKILAANGEEVYGRLTETGGTYTLTYYTFSNAGAETPYTFVPASSIDFEFSYRFDFARFPTDALIAMVTRNISDDAGNTSGIMFAEQLTITAANTFAPLTKTPTNSQSVELIINGASQDSFVDFSISGKNITWNLAAAGFSVATTDRTIARYFTLE